MDGFICHPRGEVAYTEPSFASFAPCFREGVVHTNISLSHILIGFRLGHVSSLPGGLLLYTVQSNASRFHDVVRREGQSHPVASQWAGFKSLVIIGLILG